MAGWPAACGLLKKSQWTSSRACRPQVALKGRRGDLDPLQGATDEIAALPAARAPSVSRNGHSETFFNTPRTLGHPPDPKGSGGALGKRRLELRLKLDCFSPRSDRESTHSLERVQSYEAKTLHPLDALVCTFRCYRRLLLGQQHRFQWKRRWSRNRPRIRFRKPCEWPVVQPRFSGG